MSGAFEQLKRLAGSPVIPEIKPVPVSVGNGNLREPSGPQWANRWMPSKSIDDLVSTFRTNVNRFINALRIAGVNVNVNTTLRPRQRAYLMHYAPLVAEGDIQPQDVPGEQGVNIDWVHRDPDGNPDPAESRKAASRLAEAFSVAYPAAFPTRHMLGLAIDMTISWDKQVLKVIDGNNITWTIKSLPRNGAGNLAIHRLGATYGVLKLVNDPPHWSDNGH
jgi:hypothetical protein